MTTPAEGLQRLRYAAASGVLDAFCLRHGIRVLTVFGSTARGQVAARDLDIGVLAERDATLDLFTVIDELTGLTGTDKVDLVHLNRGGPVIRERALVGAIALFESEPGALTAAQVAAIAERIETDPMRRLDLELLAR